MSLLCVPEPPAPRLLFPVSGDRVTGNPELRWKASVDGGDGEAIIRICRDAACTLVVDTLVGTGPANPTSVLMRGAYFLRAVGRRQRPDGSYLEGLRLAPVRVFFATGRSSVSRGPVGIVPDIDRDGFADIGVGSHTSNKSQISVTLSATQKTSRENGPSEQPNGFAFGAFGKAMILASDTDEDGYPEIATIDRSTGAPTPTTVVRFSYDPFTKKLVERQRFDVAIPDGQRFVSLAPLGDIDGDGLADVAVVRALPTVAESGPGGGTIFYQTGVEIEILYGGLGPVGWSRRAKTQIQLTAAQRSFESTPMPVRGVGDVDGDGVPDLAVGIQTTNPDSCFPARRGRVEIRRGSPTGSFGTVLATVEDLFDQAPLGDVNGDGLADIGATREPRETREPIAPSTTCGGSYTRTAYLPGEARVLLGGATGPFAQAAFTMPVDTVPGCTNGFASGPSFLVTGTLTGSGDLDGDGLDDLALVCPESHPGGAGGCGNAGARVRILSGTTDPTLAVAQILATPEAGFGPFTNRVRIIGGLDDTGRSALLVVSTVEIWLYAWPTGGVTSVRTLTSTDFGVTPLGGL